MKKSVLMIAAMFAMTTAMAQEDCCKKGAEKAQTEKKCEGDCANCKNHQKDGDQMKHQRPDRTAMMVSELGLNDEQAAKVKELNEKYADVVDAPRHRPVPRPEKKMGEAKDEAKVDGVTGASQQAEKPEARKMPAAPEMKQKMEEHHAKMQAYNEELKAILTEEQFAAYQEKMRPMRPGMRRMPVKK